MRRKGWWCNLEVIPLSPSRLVKVPWFFCFCVFPIKQGDCCLNGAGLQTEFLETLSNAYIAIYVHTLKSKNSLGIAFANRRWLF